MTRAIIETRALERSFGARRALAPLDFELGAAEIVGLVGPNGSGKTTLLKLLAGFLRPSAGEVRVFGLEPFARRADVMTRARFAFAPPPLWDALTGVEHLRYLGGLGGGRIGATDIDRVLELVGLSERGGDRVSAYSFGMRQRLILAQALLPTPSLLVLDEPTDGLDPLAILELREVLRRLRDEHGTAIVLSSHLLIEVDELVDRLLVLNEGEALFQGAPDELLAAGERLVLEVDDSRRAAAAFATRGVSAEPEGDSRLSLALDTTSLDEAAALLRDAGVELRYFQRERPTLESAVLERLREARP